MQKNIVKKGVASAVIILFIGVAIQPIIARDNVSPIKKSDTKELLETVLDIVNSKKIQNIIQKFESKGNLIGFQQQQSRLQKEIIGIIKKNDVFNVSVKQLTNIPCNCEKDNTNRLWHFPIICKILYIITCYLSVIYFIGTPIASAIAYYIF